MKNSPIARIKLKRAYNTQLLDADDDLAVEEPLEIKLLYGNREAPFSKVISVTMRTPGHDTELALGFLWTEGIIRHHSQVADTEESGAGTCVLVSLREGEAPRLQQSERAFFANSACGVCGKSGIASIRTTPCFQKAADDIRLNPGLFYHLEEKLREQQALFATTGGLHAAALFDLYGSFITLREDVGRHNALDKLIGAAFLKEELPLNKSILLLSGRAGFELIQKAAMAGIKVIAAVGAPSSLAVQLAEEWGITLIGFLRNRGFNIYTGGQRIG